MAADLTPLEQAAARVGLPGLKARVVPHDRRRGWWFRWGRGELLVSDRVIDRCPPEDACALLWTEVLRARRLQRLRVVLIVFGILIPAIIFAAGRFIAPHGAIPVTDLAKTSALVLVGFGLLLLPVRLRTAVLADDEAVFLLGNATPLVRGLNEMNFEEVHLAGKVLPARPDLHRRAERLVAKHQLCDAQPE